VTTKFLGIAAGLAASLFILSACETGPHGPGPYVAANVDYYDGYYDGSYGPFYDGYWGDDNYFWYRDNNSQWHRDEGHHFARTASTGFNHIHGSGMHREH
jgi:hypothetical protein